MPPNPATKPSRTYRFTDVPLYSKWLIPAGGLVGDYAFFSVQQGAAGQGFTLMTDVETNLPTSGQLPREWDFLIEQVSFQLRASAQTALAPDADFISACNNLLWGSSLEIKTPAYQQLWGPPVMWSAGFGIWSDVALARADGVGAVSQNNYRTVSNGTPGGAIRRFKYPYFLKAGAAFNITAHVRTALGNVAALECMVTLWGKKREYVGI